MKKLIVPIIILMTLSACSQLGLSSTEPTEPVDLSGIESQLDTLEEKLDAINTKLDKPVAKPKPENIQPVATVEAREEKDCSQGNGTAQNPLVSNTEENPCKYILEITKQGVIFPFINENTIVDEIYYNRGNIVIEFVSSIDADVIFTYEGVGYHSGIMPIIGAQQDESMHTNFLPMDCKCQGYMAIHEDIYQNFKTSDTAMQLFEK